MEIYKPRYFHYLENWKMDTIEFKVYFISAEKQSIENTIVEKCKDHLKQLLPKKIAEHPHNNAGYIIIHQGEMGIWLLTHWWAYDDIVLSTLSKAISAGNDFINFDDQPFHACVWEHVVINHERNAWVKHVMKKNPSLKNYHKEKLSNGYY